MRVLITGANGFVGRVLCAQLSARGCEVIACGGPGSGAEHVLDVTDAEAVARTVQTFAPDWIVHLGAQAFVPAALEAPLATYETNILGTANICAAIRAANAPSTTRLLFVSSAEVYGKHDTVDFPLNENAQLLPANPYAASKAAAEMIVLGEARSFGIDAIVSRAFNHVGPGQDERFVVPSFANQLAKIAAGGLPLMLVGNLEAQRDFLDVRDVADAYISLLEGGRRGEVYNVCSGHPVAIKDVLRELVFASRVPVEIREDPERMRPSDVPVFVGDNRKIRQHTQWSPKISLKASLRDIYVEARERLNHTSEQSV